MFTKKSISRIFSVLLVIVFMLAVTPLEVAHAAGVRYTKTAAGGTGDCSSWANACILQTALIGATSGDEIWAAAGTYKPTTGTDRTATFQLKNGVALYGGFAGTETARNQRNPATNVTILSGDIDNNDSQTPIITDLTTITGNTTNSYHVVTGATSATLDGFTITAGNANGSICPGMGCGGGMYNNSSSPTLTNVTFSGNSAENGGGMGNNYYSNPALTNVTFSGNSAENGGGMESYYYSNPALTDVTFSGNLASSKGGGIYSYYYSNPTLTNVTFSGNSAENGGGMGNLSSSNPQILNTIFWSNTAVTAGAQIYNDTTSSPLVSDSVVENGCPTGSTCTKIITADPMLGTLGNYGGFTQTIPLLAGSSAIDTGNDAVCPATDQRGVSRPQGSGCDVGAYEARHQIFIVTSNADTGGSNCGADCTLRQALNAANASDPGGTYTITFSLTYPNAIYTRSLQIENTTTIIGPGADKLTIYSSGYGGFDSFTLIMVDSKVSLSGLNIQHGISYVHQPGGGGIFNYSNGTLTVKDCVFDGNYSFGDGGGIYNSGVLTVTNSTFLDNGAYGGANIYGSCCGGGGIINFHSATVINSTFYRNSTSDGKGGGIMNRGTLTVINSSFLANSNGGSSVGGGIFTAGGTTTLHNTFLAAGDCATINGGTLTADSHNFDTDGSCANAATTTQTALNLGPLQNNGGHTNTLALQPGSVALDAGDDSFCPATDQRGVSRPQGAHCDIGAFEFIPSLYLPLIIH